MHLNIIVALMVVLLMLPIIVGDFSLVSKLSFPYEEINDELSLMDLRKILLIAYDLRVENDALYFTYHNDDYRLYLTNNHLILSPGTQIILDKIDSLTFGEEGNCIYVEYERANKKFHQIITKKESFCVDDFYGDDEQYAADNSGDE